MKNKKRNRIFLLLILLLGVTVGFAALSTTLKINGISRVKKATWSIHWDNVANEKGVTATTPAYIKDTKKTTVEYEVFFTEPGQYYEFTVDAVNEGTLDGEITQIVSTVNGNNISTLPAYIKYSIVYADNNTAPQNGDVLRKQTSRTYRVHIEYDREAVTNEIVNGMTTDQSYAFAFEVKYSQKAKEPSFATDSWKTIITNIRSNPEYYPLGATKEIDLDLDGNGTIEQNEHFHVRIANRTTPAECRQEGFSQTACGVVLDFEESFFIGIYNDVGPDYDVSDVTTYDENVGGFPNSELYHEYLENNSPSWLLNLFPTALKSAVLDTYTVSSHGTRDSSNFTSTSKLYLLSTKEIWGKESSTDVVQYDTAETETRQLDLYKASGLTTSNPSLDWNPAQKTYTYSIGNDEWKTETYYWWTRSAYGDNSWYFYTSNYYGHWRLEHGGISGGVSPVFRIG